MTVEPHQGASQVPANVPEDLNTGLEEFGIEDMVMPRLTILHRDGRFQDSLTKSEFEELNIIVLSLVKQRILWPKTMDDNDKPMCRSTDHKTGYPLMDITNKPPEKQFPWHASNFSPDDYQPDSDGQIRLPCEACALKEWGSHPDGKTPWCAEQFTLAVLYDPMSNGTYVPAVMTFQKTGLKPLRNYLTSFARSSTPPFQVYTGVSLQMLSRGNNPYCVPIFKMGSQTDPEQWGEYSIQGRSMQGFLRTPPVQLEDSEEPVKVESGSNEWTGPPQQAAPQQPAPQQAAPQQPAPQQAAPQQPQQQQPAQTAEPQPQPANPGPPAQPTQPAPPQPEPAPAPPEPSQDAAQPAAATAPAQSPAPDPWAAQTGNAAQPAQASNTEPAKADDPLPF